MTSGDGATVQRDVPGDTAERPAVSPAQADAAARVPDGFEERPELYVGGAFAGGLLLAMLLRKLGGGR